MATRSSRSSAKDRPSYRCSECGWTTVKWLGRCPECQAWGTVEEFGAAPAVRTTAAGRVTTAALPIAQVDGRPAAPPGPRGGGVGRGGAGGGGGVTGGGGGGAGGGAAPARGAAARGRGGRRSPLSTPRQGHGRAVL
ncbi:hypothetical protein AAHZ94_33180, partial [Streptomyces sp. HSW2009]